MAGSSFDEALLSHWRELLDSSPDCLLVSDYHTHRYLYANATTCVMAGYTLDELQTMETAALTMRGRDAVSENFRKAREAGPDGFTDEPRLMVSKGNKRRGWWEAQFRYAVIQEREVVVIVSREVTARVLAERAELRTRKIYAALSATNEAIIRSLSPEELFQSVCDAAIESGGITTAVVLMPEPETGLLKPKAMAGFGREVTRATVISIDPDRPEGQGLNGLAYRSGKPQVTDDFLKDERTRHWHSVIRTQTRMRSAAAVPILRNGLAIGTLHLCSRDRAAFDDEIVALLVRMADNVSYALHSFEQEEERRQAEERAHYLATHCSLTGLPNRNLLSDLLEQALASVSRTGHNPAIMFVDLDHFKEVNDNWGHDTGDQVLEKVACRMREVLRDHDVLARLGGDEFVVLVQNIDRRAHAVRVAGKLLDALNKPVKVDGHEFLLTCSIGISLYPDHGLRQRELMKAADLAMYVAKEKGKNTWAFAGDDPSQRISCVDEQP